MFVQPRCYGLPHDCAACSICKGMARTLKYADLHPAACTGKMHYVREVIELAKPGLCCSSLRPRNLEDKNRHTAPGKVFPSLDQRQVRIARQRACSQVKTQGFESVKEFAE